MRRPAILVSHPGLRRGPRLQVGSWLAVAGWLTAASCVADGPESNAALALERYCATVCQSRSSCGLEQPNSGCVALCEHDPNACGRQAAFWNAQTTCLDSQSCAAWLAEAARDSCLGAALRTLTPSPRCIEYCETDAARSFECGAGYSVEECVRGLTCSYREDVLEALGTCNAEPDCDTRASCLATQPASP